MLNEIGASALTMNPSIFNNRPADAAFSLQGFL